MDEREEEVRADILIFRSLASLDASVREMAMVQMGLNMALITERNQATVLFQLYEGIAELAVRLGSWEEALLLTRTTALQGSGDKDMQYAYEKFIRQTNHLFNL